MDPHYLWFAKVEESLTFEVWQWFDRVRGAKARETAILILAGSAALMGVRPIESG
jgi:hypothetical protein